MKLTTCFSGRYYTSPHFFLIVFIILFFTLYFRATLSFSQDTSLLREIEEAASSINSLACEFRQEKHLAMFDEVLISRGRFYFQKPDRLRWEYLEPVRMGFVLAGRKGKRWNEIDGKEISFDPQKERGMKVLQKQLLAWATFDLKWLQKKYSIKILDRNPVVLFLRPKNTKQQILDYLSIIFAEDRKTIDTIELHEKDKDFTRIKFINPEVNVILPEDIFK